MATMNISLPNPMREWVEQQIQGGRYSNNSDYVRDLIRRDQEQRDKTLALQQAITQGLESGLDGKHNHGQSQAQSWTAQSWTVTMHNHAQSCTIMHNHHNHGHSPYSQYPTCSSGFH